MRIQKKPSSLEVAVEKIARLERENQDYRDQKRLVNRILNRTDLTVEQKEFLIRERTTLSQERSA